MEKKEIKKIKKNKKKIPRSCVTPTAIQMGLDIILAASLLLIEGNVLTIQDFLV